MPYGSGIAKGLALTFSKMFTRPVTIQYPDERMEVAQRFRGELVLTHHEDDKLKCRACGICEKACPDGLIDIDDHADDEGKTYVDTWRWESYACMFCGLCVDACPFEALEWGRDYEHASYVFDRLYKTLAADELSDKPVRKKKAAEPADEGGEQG